MAARAAGAELDWPRVAWAGAVVVPLATAVFLHLRYGGDAWPLDAPFVVVGLVLAWLWLLLEHWHGTRSPIVVAVWVLAAPLWCLTVLGALTVGRFVLPTAVAVSVAAAVAGDLPRRHR